MKIKNLLLVIIAFYLLMGGNMFGSGKIINVKEQSPINNNVKQASLIVTTSGLVTGGLKMMNSNNQKDVYDLQKARDEYKKNNSRLWIFPAKGAGKYLYYKDGIQYGKDVIQECQSNTKSLRRFCESVKEYISNQDAKKQKENKDNEYNIDPLKKFKIEFNIPTDEKNSENTTKTIDEFVEYCKQLDTYANITDKNTINKFIAGIFRSPWIIDVNNSIEEIYSMMDKENTNIEKKILEITKKKVEKEKDKITLEEMKAELKIQLHLHMSDTIPLFLFSNSQKDPYLFDLNFRLCNYFFNKEVKDKTLSNSTKTKFINDLFSAEFYTRPTDASLINRGNAQYKYLNDIAEKTIKESEQNIHNNKHKTNEN